MYLKKGLGWAATVAVLSSCLAGCDPKPAEPPLSTPQPAVMAALGKQAFFDSSLSASGRLSCAGCHSPAHGYGPPNALATQLGGPDMHDLGARAAPSLRYTLARTPFWGKEYQADPIERVTETDSVPVGGFGWDGRFNTLAQQAGFPLLAPNEMANASIADVVERLSKSAYAGQFRKVFGQDIFSRPDAAFAALTAAIERFELDDPSFHPYSSKFDQYLDGKAAFSEQESRGLKLFSDPEGGNCTSCHIALKGANGSHPLFTDFSFEALGVPRNAEIPANADASYYDLGLCGPVRTDQSQNQAYCGLFKTPSLRNVATRGAFFHNGRFHTLSEVLHFYVERDTAAGKWYPRPDGKQRFDDLPKAMQENVDVLNAPLNRHAGDAPAWSDADIADVTAFLRTLTDADAVQR